MKYRFSQLAILIFMAPLLSQCVPSQDITNLDLKIRNINNRVIELNKTVDKLGSPAHTSIVSKIQSKQAALSDSLDEMKMKMLQIRGQLAESRHNLQNIQSDNKTYQAALNQKAEGLAEQITLLADQLNQTNEQLNILKKDNETALNASKEAIKQAQAASAQAKIAEDRAITAQKAVRKKSLTKKGPRKITPSQKKTSPQEHRKTASSTRATTKTDNTIYDKALGLFRKSKFNESYRTFSKYLSKSPKGKLAPNARFWMGDCYYSQQEYELAILEYQKVIADFPKHSKAPAALLKQGLAFEKLKDNDTAKIIYKKLTTQYPKSDQMTTAQKRLSTLK